MQKTNLSPASAALPPGDEHPLLRALSVNEHASTFPGRGRAGLPARRPEPLPRQRPQPTCRRRVGDRGEVGATPVAALRPPPSTPARGTPRRGTPRM